MATTQDRPRQLQVRNMIEGEWTAHAVRCAICEGATWERDAEPAAFRPSEMIEVGLRHQNTVHLCQGCAVVLGQRLLIAAAER